MTSADDERGPESLVRYQSERLLSPGVALDDWLSAMAPDRGGG